MTVPPPRTDSFRRPFTTIDLDAPSQEEAKGPSSAAEPGGPQGVLLKPAHGDDTTYRDYRDI
jgi:hypothetical protein